MIYFILNPESNVVKIGYTQKDIEKRLANLQVGNHAELKLIGVVDGTPKHEKYYHDLFAEYRTKGEWFKYGEKLQEFIENIDTSLDDIEDDNVSSEKVVYIKLSENKIVNYYPGNKWNRKLEPSAFYMLLPLLLLENTKTGEITMNTKNRKFICENFSCSTAHLSLTLKRLVDHKVIKRVRRGVYMVDPLKMCIGKKTAQQTKLNKYMMC